MKRRALTAAAPLAVAAGAVLSFLPALDGGFLFRDDRQNIFENAHLFRLGASELKWMFTTVHYFGNYEPLNWLVYSLTRLVWGMDPRGFHLTGVLLHAGAALAFYFTARLLLKLARAAPDGGEDALSAGAAFAALLFAVHPLRVEVAAWASAQHYSIAAIFYLIAIHSYLRANDPAEARFRRRRLGAALAAFVLSLLSFPIGMTLPLILLVLDFYPLRRVELSREKPLPAFAGLLREKAYFFLFAAVAALVQILARGERGSLVALEKASVIARVAHALYGLAFYVRKTALPFDLLPYYRIPAKLDFASAPYVLSAAAVVLGAFAVIAARRRWPAAAAAAAAYAAGLAPVLGLTQSGLQLVADRYSYLPCLVWAALGGAALARVWRRPRARAAVLALAAAIVIALGSLSWRQTRIWKDDVSLWGYNLARDPERADLHGYLAYALMRRGRLSESAEHYRVSLQLDPSNLAARINYGNMLLATRRFDEAGAQFRMVLRRSPSNIATLYDMGLVLIAQGKPSEALAEYRKILEIDPNYARARLMIQALERSIAKSRAAVSRKGDL